MIAIDFTLFSILVLIASVMCLAIGYYSLACFIIFKRRQAAASAIKLISEQLQLKKTEKYFMQALAIAIQLEKEDKDREEVLDKRAERKKEKKATKAKARENKGA